MTTPDTPPSRTRRRREERARRHRVSVVGVIGELLITAGVFVFLFLGWQLWLNDIIVGNEQNAEARAFSQQLDATETAPPPEPTEDGYGDPVITAAVSETTPFATMYVPRFGSDWVKTIAEGKETNVINSFVGHYPGTQMPGEVGNFAVAGHRTTWGAPFNRIAELQVGDKIFVKTADGWYTYVFRSMEYVRPTGVGVLAPVPQQPEVQATGRMMTMTSCNPMLSDAERIIAYSVFDSWQPLSAGPPAEIADSVQAGA